MRLCIVFILRPISIYLRIFFRFRSLQYDIDNFVVLTIFSDYKQLAIPYSALWHDRQKKYTVYTDKNEEILPSLQVI